MAVEDKLNINLNQNLWGIVVSYAAVGLAERYGFHQLWWLAFIVACCMSASVVVSFAFYTYNYCRQKLMGLSKRTSS